MEFQGIESHTASDLLPISLPDQDKRAAIVLCALSYVRAGLYSRILANVLRMSADERVRERNELGARCSNRALAATFTHNHSPADQETVKIGR